MFVGNLNQFKPTKVTRDRLALTSLHRQKTREERWGGSSAPNSLGFLQISHPADAKTSLGGGWGGAGLWGASLPWDAGGGIDDARPPPGSARDSISLCQRRSSQAKAVLSAHDRAGAGGSSPRGHQTCPQRCLSPGCRWDTPAVPPCTRMCPRTPARTLWLLPAFPGASPGRSSGRIKARLLASKGLTPWGAAAEAEPPLPPGIAGFAARLGVVELTSRWLIPRAGGNRGGWEERAVG